MGIMGLPDGTVKRVRTKKVLWGEYPPKFKLNPCPNCGANQEDGSVLLYFIGAINCGAWRVICQNCNYMVGELTDEKNAVNQWNGVDIE